MNKESIDLAVMLPTLATELKKAARCKGDSDTVRLSFDYAGLRFVRLQDYSAPNGNRYWARVVR